LEVSKIPIVKPGDKLPATYLERFDPAENVTYRLSVLSTSAIAVEFHWVDIPSKNIKATHQCIQGICCQALGRRSQTYSVPIYVYSNPQQGSTEGDLYVFQMTPARWKKFSDLAMQADLTQWDLTFTAQKRGMGMDWSYSVLPDYKFRDYWTPDQKEQLKLAVESFYQMGESSLVTPMTYNDWNQLLYDIGYDVQNQCWPSGQSPMNSGAAFQSIGRAVGSAVLPPAPPIGYSQVPQAIPAPVMATGVVGGVVFQPPQPTFGAVPQQGFRPGVVGNTGLPPTQVMHQPVLGVPNAMSTVPQVGFVPVGGPATVPLGTAPVMPSLGVVPVTQSQQVVSAPQNEVAGAMEITASELNKLLE